MRDERLGQGPQVAPVLLGGVQAPDRTVAQVVLPEPVPAVDAGRGAKAEEPAAHRIEHVLRGAADPGGSGVGFQKLELGPPGSGLRLTQVLGD